MNKLFVPILIVLTLILTACGSASGATQTDSIPSDGSLPAETQLILGTIKLEGTDHAVTAEQAAELLPLWQVYQDLSQSDTAAQEEIDGLFEQIQSTMTSEQTEAIAGLNLTQPDVMAAMQDYGAGMSGVGQDTSLSTSQSNDSSAAPPDGGDMTFGAPPDGGDMPAGGQTTSDQSPSATQSGGTNTMQSEPSSSLVGALIELLQSKLLIPSDA